MRILWADIAALDFDLTQWGDEHPHVAPDTLARGDIFGVPVSDAVRQAGGFVLGGWYEVEVDGVEITFRVGNVDQHGNALGVFWESRPARPPS